MNRTVTPEAARRTLVRLRDLTEAIGKAVTENNLAALDRLVPEEEALIAEIGGTHVDGSEDGLLRDELRDLVADIFRKNTKNALLIQEQLALVRTTVRAILGERGTVDHLA